MTSSEASGGFLSLERVSVYYDDSLGLEDVSLGIAKGEIHAVVGEHGAGKSTLAKVLSGVVPATAGTIRFDGTVLDNATTRYARDLGICTLHQSDNLLMNLNAVENVYLHREIRKNFMFADDALMRDRVEEILKTFDLRIDSQVPVKNLDYTQQKLVEFAKLVCFPAKVIIVDDISSKLSQVWIDKIHFILSMMRREGVTVVYIASDINEVFNFADRVTVMAKGRIVETTDISNLDKLQLVQLTYSSLFRREQLEKSNLELFYRDNFNKAIINNIPLPILVCDSEGEIVIANKMFESACGLDEASIIGRPVADYLGIEEQDRCDAAENGQMVRTRCALKRGGTAAEFDLSVVRCVDDDKAFIGRIYFLGSLGSDVDLNRRLRAYRPVDDYQRTYAELVHEINNPLGIMLNYIRLLKSETDEDQVQADATIIENEIKRVKKITERFRTKNVPAKPDCPPVDMRALMDGIAALLRPTVGDRIELRAAVAKEAGPRVDPDLLKQVVLNMVINGVEAIPGRGSIELRVEARRDGNGSSTVIAISDSGSGIRAADRDRIFEPYFTTKEGPGQRGLGLSLSKDLVDRMNGRIRVESELGRGTTFEVSVPD